MVGGFAVVLVTSVLLWTFGSAPQPDPSTPASESDVAAKIEFTNSVAAMHQKKAANSEKGTAKAEAVEPAAKKKPRLNKIVKKQADSRAPAPRMRERSNSNPISPQAFFQATIAERQRQARQQRSDQWMQKMRTCNHCGGAGTYRYVDGQGKLIAKSCPKCYGTGSSMGFNDPRFRY